MTAKEAMEFLQGVPQEHELMIKRADGGLVPATLKKALADLSDAEDLPAGCPEEYAFVLVQPEEVEAA